MKEKNFTFFLSFFSSFLYSLLLLLSFSLSLSSSLSFSHSSSLSSSHSSLSSFSSSSSSNLHELYEKFPVENGEYRVQTIISNRTISEPSGIERGIYNDQSGVFISSTSQFIISFWSEQVSNYRIIAGMSSINGNQDGQMLYSSFSSPTRMAYDYRNHRLYVTEKQSGIIRLLDFKTDQVKTLYRYNTLDNNQLEVLQFEKSVQSGGDFPGLDIQISSNNIPYVVDTIKLYRISSITSINGVFVATVQEYSSLSTYLNSKGYPVDANLRSCIYSVAPDDRRKVLYVSVSYAKNVILQVPMDPNESFEKISVLLGSEQLSFQGSVSGYPPPTSLNGNVRNGVDSVFISFPLHLRLSISGNILYFSEAYPTTSDGRYLFGSLSIRRYQFQSGEVDTYCGVDYSHNLNNDTYYHLIGSMGGYRDSDIATSSFAYPMSIAIQPSENELNYQNGNAKDNEKDYEVVFHVIYVADHSNHAVRMIYPTMNTPNPTPFPTRYSTPSSFPSEIPTLMTPSSSFSSLSLPAFEYLLLLSTTFLLMLILCCCYWMAFLPSPDRDKREKSDRSQSKSNISESGENEEECNTSHSGFFQTPKSSSNPPKQQSTVHDYVISSWNQVNRRIHMAGGSLDGRRKNNQRESDDGKNALLDVSMSSTTSSLENEDWEEVVWKRSPNLNISKQYRLSDASWSITPLKLDPLMSSGSLEKEADETKDSPNTEELFDPNWNTVTPTKQNQSFDTKPRSSAPQSLFGRIRNWLIWNREVSGDTDSDCSSKISSDTPSERTKIEETANKANKTPRTLPKNWRSDRWDEVDDNIVAFQF